VKPDESDLSFFLGSIKCFQDAAFGVRQLRVVVVNDAVDLPKVQMIGKRTTETAPPA
jgi:hypothetical protein